MESSDGKLLKFKYHNLSVFSDGSILRSPYDPPPLSASPSFGDGEVASKDVILNHSSQTWVRIFLPRTSSASPKLPVPLFFHGGAFCLGSSALPSTHHFLCKLAAASNTLIVSVDYRLAPEHRLPTAYDDGFDALIWLHEQANIQNRGKFQAHETVGEEAKLPVDDHGTVVEEPWLADHADFSRCFLGGVSAGGNITHHVAMRAASQTWEYLRLQGMILIHPFFGGEVPTGDELRNPNFAAIALEVWKLSLPEGADRDDPASKPRILADDCLPRALVAVASDDELRDRGVEYFEALKRAGKEAKLFTSENEGHGFHQTSPESQNFPALLQELVLFLNASPA